MRFSVYTLQGGESPARHPTAQAYGGGGWCPLKTARDEAITQLHGMQPRPRKAQWPRQLSTRKPFAELQVMMLQGRLINQPTPRRQNPQGHHRIYKTFEPG
jgi:hypothetical protein